MRRVLALGVVAAMCGAFAWACSNDTFTSGDADSAEAGGDPQLAAFCDAEVQYATTCGVIEAGCVQQNLAHCAATYATFNPSFAQDIVSCVTKGQLSCSSPYAEGGCLQNAIVGFANDSDAFAGLATDYCHTCAPTDLECVKTFGAGAGALAEIFSDPTIESIETTCLHDGGVTAALDASGCTKDFIACELLFAATVEPASACDGGT